MLDLKTTPALFKVQTVHFWIILMQDWTHATDNNATGSLLESRYAALTVSVMGVNHFQSGRHDGATKGDREKCMKAGKDDYVEKPTNPEEQSIQLNRPRDLRPRGQPKGWSMGEDLLLFLFANPIGYAPAASLGQTNFSDPFKASLSVP